MTIQTELAGLISRHTPEEGVVPTAIPRLALVRASQPTAPLHALHQPALCLIAQGRKRVILGEHIYTYDHSRFLVVSVDVPVIGQVIEATPEQPYLCLRLDLDPGTLGRMMMELGLDGKAGSELPGSSLVLSDVTPELLDAATRLARLLDAPRDISVLAPLAEREILYRLFMGEQGPRLCQIARAESKLQQVNRAIGWIRQHYSKAIRIDDVAAAARMSPSALHEHFKAVTSMSPLQYQKQLRLQEARRLMLGEAMDAASAGFTVGYESPSQFSREYSRLFGAPPLRDMARLRAVPQASV